MENKEIQINVNLDKVPILYTDSIFMSINSDGVVFDVAQRFGPSNHVQVVARIGMSKAHAKKFVSQIAELVKKSEGQAKTGNQVIN